jgi:1-acyl-sn-glycerol-3-phosphate acyltransferase
MVDQLDYFRYPCTASGERFERDAGMAFSSRESLSRFKREIGRGSDLRKELPAESDPFGLDEPFIRAAGKTGLRFFEKTYWRIECRGFENIPKEGKAIIVGPHRGFMPLDAVMIVHLVTKYAGRVPRFLLHPTLVKFPVLTRFMWRMGGVMACEKNAEWVLNRCDILGVYPEGIHGAFKMYRDAYKLGKFGWPNYIHWALKHNAPVVPFVIVGSAEIFPILGKIPLPWLKQYLEWPFIPVTPTFPWLPVPLPTKWHVQFLPALDPAGVRAEAARIGVDPVGLIGRRVREAIEAATDEMRAKRRSVFWGNIWTHRNASRTGADLEP